MPETAERAKAPSHPWLENVEAMTMAVIMALFLKYFVVEAYKIPSGSMQPTLIGLETSKARIEDRILVDKLSYCFREPRRWEVVVFRYPLDRSKNFVKRLVGLPGESLRIAEGDVWTRTDESEPWTIARRPRAVQRVHWKRIDVDDPADPARTSWRTDVAGWSARGRSIEARGPGQASFRPEDGSIMDEYHHGYPDSVLPFVPRVHQDSGTHAVGDLRLAADVRALEGCEAVELRLREGSRTYAFRVPGPAASEAEVPTVRVRDDWIGGGTPDRSTGAEASYRLPAGRAVRVAAQNMDDLLELLIDGEVVCAVETEPARDQTSGADLVVLGAGADLTDVQLYRDVYYTNDRSKTTTTRVPEGMYFMLGDNTQNSSDSREWTFARYRVEDPETGESRVVRGNYEHGSNPWVDVGNPEGPVVWLRDEWGERHAVPQSDAQRLETETAPFVPRDMVLGRAVATFWPIDPFDGLYRLGWVR